MGSQMDDKLRIYLTGINGVGKTTVGKLLERRAEMKYIQASKVLLDALGLRHQYELHNLPREEKLDTLESKLLKYFERYPKLVLDSHLVVYCGNKLEYIFREFYVPHITVLINLIARPETIRDRRLQDKRDRLKSTDLKEIVRELELSIKTASEVSQKYNIPLFTISNDGDINETIDEILKILGKL